MERTVGLSITETLPRWEVEKESVVLAFRVRKMHR